MVSGVTSMLFHYLFLWLGVDAKICCTIVIGVTSSRFDFDGILLFPSFVSKNIAEWIRLAFPVDIIQFEQYAMQKSLVKRCNVKLVSSVAVVIWN